MSTFLTVPEEFAARTIRREGPAGAEWIATLPTTARTIARRWGLTVESAAMAGTTALVWLVQQRGRPAALKIGWPDLESRDEAAALRAWDGDGAVRVLDVDAKHHALLLERLDPRPTLLDMPIDTAVETMVRVLHRLHTASAALDRPRALAGFMPVLAQMDASDGAGASDAGLLGARVAAEAVMARRPSVLLHGDFHYENVLSGERGWTAIDPKPALGAPEWDYLPLLRNRFDAYGAPGVHGVRDVHASIRRRLRMIVTLDDGDAEAATVLCHYRARLNIAFARHVGDASFLAVATALAEATAEPGEASASVSAGRRRPADPRG
ncbi:aminoglycoside phosphotransferase family protein [Curtobacterium ammoniigenes]|uniref:aminoglycoside phosphotransferase family protein n=1 Tax=Curtobacterium ammoniigenes TaxID=395387 RepID=UPI0008345993|nr:aminoglycoside phosphotransferase family protein [Curtobacterium ammoniigenes]